MSSSVEFALIRQSRQNLIAYLEQYTIAELNAIPIGFNNNMIWNIAHIVATFDILCYKLNNIPPRLDTNFIDNYKKGTTPKFFENQEFILQLKKQLLEQVDWIEEDFLSDVFPSKIHTPYMTSFNFQLTSIEDILKFNIIHEGLHFGVLMSLKNFI